MIEFFILVVALTVIIVLAWDNRHYNHVWRDDDDHHSRRP